MFTVLTAVSLALAGLVSSGDPVPQGKISRQPYFRFTTTDEHARTIDFYVSEPPRIEPERLRPLVVYVHGSGATSHFTRDGDRTVPRNGHITFAELADDRVRVLVVEKPGVQFGDAPTGAAAGGTDVFRREHTLERWADAVVAAMEASLRLPGVAADRVTVVGHSEGGIVAARIARLRPELVTHVAVLAGGGPTQLYSLIALAREGQFFGHVSNDPEARVAYVLDAWADICADPRSTEKTFFGFAYRRWSSFLSTSPADELDGVQARIYVGQGLDDRAVAPTSADMLFATLRARQQDVMYDRVPGAGHSFERSGDQDGWSVQIARVLDWACPGEQTP